ncbi:MAG: phosphoribosylanthranilate isomerase [Campylobacterota bacterium]
MQKVKICGLTDLQDALIACHSGADALGFVFYKQSRRYVEPKTVKSIVQQLPPFVKTVGLFVNESSDFINKTIHECNLDLAQIHFEVDATFLQSLEVPYLPVIRAKNPQDITQYEGEFKIVDSYCESYGGSGKRLNLEWFEGIDCSKIILAGGLDAGNVAQTHKYGFYGVDVSSGVEMHRGKKDKIEIEKFINHAKKR